MKLNNDKLDGLNLGELDIVWVDYSSLVPNDYNPNEMTESDRLLLRQSLLEDGWLAPLIASNDRVIIDGEQRWTVAGLPISSKVLKQTVADLEEERTHGDEFVSEVVFDRLRLMLDFTEAQEAAGKVAHIYDFTNGQVPVVFVDYEDLAHKVSTTIRMNAARGVHEQEQMIEIVRDLHKLGFDFDQFKRRLGMDKAEVTRYISSLPTPERILNQTDGFGAAWEPVSRVLADDVLEDRNVATNVKSAAVLAAAQKSSVENRQESLAQAQGPTDLLALARSRAAAALKINANLETPTLDKLMFFVTAEQYDRYSKFLLAFGNTEVDGFIQLCKEYYRKHDIGAKYGKPSVS